MSDSIEVSIRKCRPEIEAYLKAQYGDKLPPDVEFWEKLPTADDARYWIDALSEQAMKADGDEFGYGDPVVDQYYFTNKDPEKLESLNDVLLAEITRLSRRIIDKDVTEAIRELGKLIDAKKQEISERFSGRMAGTAQGRKDIAYLTGQMDGLRDAIKLLQGGNI